MTRIKKILFIGIPVLAICLILVTMRLFFLEHSYLMRTEKLESNLKDARQREEKAVVVRHVSKQMEEIAYQQKDISDKQRKEAEFQASENFRMKLRVEEEWKNAVTAQQEAVEAYRLADKQKALAEERQYQAEHSKRVADTLAYLTLGRSLASLSVTQYKTGNTEIASLLAYAAWNFVKRYRGDVYLSSLFNSLFMSSRQYAVWQRLKGGVMAVVFSPVSEAKDTFYSVTNYGEMMLWSADGHGGYRTKTLFSDPQYDFRSACLAPNGDLYALSYDGKLVKLSYEQPQLYTLEGKNYTQMLFADGKCLLVSANGSTVFTEKERPLYSSPDITCMKVIGNKLCIGKRNGNILWMTLSGEEPTLSENYHRAPVTAFGYCPQNKQFAIGYGDGTLLLGNSDGTSYRKLVGHRSAITSIELCQNKLYSCSYDRTIRLWNLSAERPESVVVMENSSWLHSLAFDCNEEVLFAGDENGNIYRMCVAPDRMAANIGKNLPRNFTPEEWVYYMGNQIPYEVYTSKKDDL